MRLIVSKLTVSGLFSCNRRILGIFLSHSLAGLDMSWQGVYMIFLACRKGNVADLHSPGSEIYKRNRLAWLQCSVDIEFVHWQSSKIIFQSISITKIFDKLVDSCHILSWVVLSLGKIKSAYERREQCFFRVVKNMVPWYPWYLGRI